MGRALEGKELQRESSALPLGPHEDTTRGRDKSPPEEQAGNNPAVAPGHGLQGKALR